MNVSPVVSFRSSQKQNTLKENRQKQDFYEEYDRHLNETLEGMPPQFLNGNYDTVFITSGFDKNGDLRTVKVSAASVDNKDKDTLLPEKKQNIFSKLFNRNEKK